MTAPGPANATREEPPKVTFTNLTFDATTGTFACAWTPVTGQCQGQFSPDSTRKLEHVGTPLKLAGTLKWTATAPTGSELLVAIWVKQGNGLVTNNTLPAKRGASPLAFDFDLAKLKGLDLYVDVSSFTAQGAGDVGGGASVGQAFHFEGTLSSQAEK